MKLVYAPSARRAIPYPPVGTAVLAGALKAHGVDDVTLVDLEVLVTADERAGNPCLLYGPRRPRPADAFATILPEELWEFGGWLAELVHLRPEEPIGISVMGFEQLASAVLLTRVALAGGSRVMFGGQFFTQDSAEDLVERFAPFGDVTVTVGDGWHAVTTFVEDPATVPQNSIRCRDGEVRRGVLLAGGDVPEPDYSTVDWAPYRYYGSQVYRSDAAVSRAHLYIWDKKCNFRCAFCRVSSGSKARLNRPGDVMGSLEKLVSYGVRQLNLMTNELNPSRTYLLRFLDEFESRIDEEVDWFAYMRADELEAQDLRRVRSIGGRLLRYGIETGSQRMLDLMRKDYSVPIVEQTLRRAEAADVWNHCNFLLGFPGEMPDDVDETIAFVERNADVIHSVRINPFYLPPDTPIAADPEAFGIRLTGFDKGWWTYELEDGSQVDPGAIVADVQRLGARCVELGISFAGTEPFFLLDVLSRFDSRREAYEYLHQEHPYFWKAAPTDVYKAILGGYETTADWRDTTLKRGRNYSLSICTD